MGNEINNEVFEFIPKYNITKSMTPKDIKQKYDISHDIFKSRCEKNGIDLTKDKLTKEECNLIVNERTNIENWRIKNYLPLAEVSRKLGYVPSSVRNKIERYSIPTVQQEIWSNGKPMGYVWLSMSNFKRLEGFIQDEILNSNPTTWVICSDISKKQKVCLRTVQKIAKNNNIPFFAYKGKHLFSRENGKRLEKLVKEFSRKKRERTFKGLSPEEILRKEHPLVKNLKFFEEDFFPESVPYCFQEVED